MRMEHVEELFMKVLITMYATPHTDTMTSSDGSIEGLGSPVRQLDQLKQQPEWDSLFNSEAAARIPVHAHTGEWAWQALVSRLVVCACAKLGVSLLGGLDTPDERCFELAGVRSAHGPCEVHATAATPLPCVSSRTCLR